MVEQWEIEKRIDRNEEGNEGIQRWSAAVGIPSLVQVVLACI